VSPDSKDGVVRFQARYIDMKGSRRSAGAFSTEKAAIRAWQRAEDKLAEGRLGDPRRGRQKSERYPCRGIKTPPIPRRPRTIVTPEQFDAIYNQLPTKLTRLIAESDVETGLRWGEPDGAEAERH
jgi:hypothetical protein